MSIEVYVTEWCAACHTELPRIKREANKLGLQVEVVDVDRCDVKHRDTCSRIEFVPTLMYQGREISVEQLQQMANKD